MITNKIATAVFFLLLGVAQAAQKKEEIPANALRYGEAIYMQNRGVENAWLTGGRWTDNKFIYTRNMLGSNYERNGLKSYQWNIRSVPAPKDRDNKKGQCVRYGDVVYFQNNGRQDLLISGIRARDNLFVYTYKYKKEARTTHQFRIRSNPGYGDKYGKDKDPAKGECITDLSAVYIISAGLNLKWLQGADGKEDVRTTNLRRTGYEEDTKYVWILRRNYGTGSTDDALVCAPKKVEGAWIVKGSSNGDQSITYGIGITNTESEDYTKSSNWEASVSVNVESSFGLAGNGGSVGVTAGFSYGQDISNTISQSLERSSNQDYTSSFGPGTVWQYVTEVADICGKSTDVQSPTLYVTDSHDEPPCCVPGLFLDAVNHAHGPCKPGSPCSCAPDVCNGDKMKLDQEKEWEEKQLAEQHKAEWEARQNESSDSESESESESSESYSESESESYDSYEEDDDDYYRSPKKTRSYDNDSGSGKGGKGGGVNIDLVVNYGKDGSDSGRKKSSYSSDDEDASSYIESFTDMLVDALSAGDDRRLLRGSN